MTTSKLGKRTHPEGAEDDLDDFVVLDETLDLPIRSKRLSTESNSVSTTADKPPEVTPVVDFNPLEGANSLLVSVRPPSNPVTDFRHVPCDIVLVIDISGSMAELAPLPDAENEEESEATGLTVLDLVRHACRTIISTLNEQDRLSLVTFSQDAKVIQELTSMNSRAKAAVLEKVEKLKQEGATNLWAGIKTGLQQFETHAPVGNVQGLYVLTDGQPNYMCPQQGYIPKMKPILQSLFEGNGSAPTIQTFGFGYNIRSDLMLSIAKIGHGNYAFIPEVGMIGTVFVHAVANLYATYATNVKLELTTPDSAAYWSHESGLSTKRSSPRGLVIQLGNIQYGQSRDLVISHTANGFKSGQTIKARLVYTPHGGFEEAVNFRVCFKQILNLPQALSNYHIIRNELCKFFWTLYPTDPIKEQHITASAETVKSLLSDFQALVTRIASMPNHASDSNLSAILSDLIGPQLNPKTPELGQVYQALQTDPQRKDDRVFKSYWQKWGRHYLSSLWCAHMRQTCNSFKDPGPLRYGINSDLFKRCRDELDQAFDNLPAPVGTYQPPRHDPAGHHGARGMNILAASKNTKTCARRVGGTNSSFSMKRYNRADSGCILGSCPVTMANGQNKLIQDLRLGDMIYSPLTSSAHKVTGILRGLTTGSTQEICRVGHTLWITPYHPIFDSITTKWIFPRAIAEETRFLATDEAVYSVLLAPSSNPNAHALDIGGVSCVTLGHGVISPSNEDQADARAHSFFGDRETIAAHLHGLTTDQYGRWLCTGMLRDEETGLACGLLGIDVDGEIAERVDDGDCSNVGRDGYQHRYENVDSPLTARL